MSKPAPEPKEKVEPKKKCFIIGPIGSTGTETRRNADFLLQGIIVEALKDMPYEIIRADQESAVGSITIGVVNRILESDLIIADLSEHNPNAFYELGIAHASRKTVIHVCRKDFSIPFDNSHERTVFFDLSDWQEIVLARSALRRMVDSVLSPEFVVSNPFTMAMDVKRMSGGNPEEQKIAELTKDNERLTFEKENAEEKLEDTRTALANAQKEISGSGMRKIAKSSVFFPPLYAKSIIDEAIEAQKKFEELNVGAVSKN